MNAAWLLAAAVVLASTSGPLAGAIASTASTTCDATSLLACADAASVASASCVRRLQTASCEWTRSAAWGGRSPAGLPGSAEVRIETVVATCLNAGCSSTATEAARACAWNVGAECDGHETWRGGVSGIILAAGDCFRLTVEQSVTVVARSVGADVVPDPPVGTATAVATAASESIVCG